MNDDANDDDQPQRDYCRDEASVRYYAREQEGLPPPLPSTAYLWIPHRRWLREVYPMPRPDGGWPASNLSFEEYLVREGIPVPPHWAERRRPTAVAPVDPTAPVQQTLPGLPPEE